MAIVRTDTTLVGPCDGLPCWIVNTHTYPPTDLNILSYNTQSLVVDYQYISTNSLTSVTFANNLIPIIAIPTIISSAYSVAVISIECYNSTNGDYLGNLVTTDNDFALGIDSSDNTASITFMSGIPSTYSYPSVLSSVPYTPFIGFYLFFITRVSYDTRCNPFSSDLTSLINSDGSYSYPSAVEGFIQIVQGSGTDSTYNGYTSIDTWQQFSRVGMIFYSNGLCGDSVSFQGIDNTTQSSSTSYGPCFDSPCSYSNSQFICGEAFGANSAIIVTLIAGVILLIVVVVVVILVNSKNNSENN